MKRFVFAFFSLIGCSVQVGSAATFTSEAAWQAAAGAYETEDFESLGVLGTEVTTLPSIGIDFATINNIYDGSAGGPFFGSYSLINTYPLNPNQLEPFSFTSSNGQAITAVGVWNSSGDEGLVLEFYDSDNLLMEDVLIGSSSSRPVFGGIVNSAGAVRVQIRSDGTGNQWIAIDNLQVTLAVPEPTSLALLALGTLACLCGRRLRNR